MTTLVVCIDRDGAVPSGTEVPVLGREAIENLVVDVGVDDPEDSRVNTMLEGLRVARDVEADGGRAHVALVGDRGDGVSADRSVARQIDELVDALDVDSAVVVLDSAEDERLVPVVESRLQVDAVDRVVVRQAHDIESTYYLLKQFLADEELRKTVLVPVGVALIAFPLLLVLTNSPAFAFGAITAAVGAFLLYKGLGVDDLLSRLSTQVTQALYAGQVSLVTYVVAAGLSLVGLFVGGLAVRGTETVNAFLLVNRFAFESVPWLTAASLAAAVGRLLDELIGQDGDVRSAFVNLPFAALAVGLLTRGFAGFFLVRGQVFDPLAFGPVGVGPLEIDRIVLDAGFRLALFILAGIVVSVAGVRTAAYFRTGAVREEFVE